MLEELKKEVYEANMLLPRYGLITMTWGNVSAVDRERGLVAIKPSGVSYEAMRPEDMVIVDMEGAVVEGGYRPSSDTPTHIWLYRAFPEIGGVVHTHSTFATVFAQCESGIPCYGTTHADSFYGEVPCTRNLDGREVEGEYELNTGKVIEETFRKSGLDPLAAPGVLVCKHGPFTWGSTAAEAVENAVVLEKVAEMAYLCRTMEERLWPAPQYLLDKHYYRKHGPGAYYGQGGSK